MSWLNIFKTIAQMYGTYISLGLIVFIILAVLSIFLVSIFTKTPFSFGIGFFKINFGRKEFPINKDSLITNLLEYQEEHVRRVIEIESQTLKRQLSYTEQKLTQMKYLMSKSYSTILSSRLSASEDVNLHKDYRSYQILIGILIDKLVDTVFREAFIQNHLDEMDGTTWNNYLEDKFAYISNFNADFLDNLYGNGRLVSRREAYEEELKLSNNIKEIVKSIFNYARDIGIQSKSDIKKENQDSDLHIKQICKSSGFESLE